MTNKLRLPRVIRVFGGKRYALWTTFGKKSEALKIAKNLRETGHSARVVTNVSHRHGGTQVSYSVFHAEPSHVKAWEKTIRERREHFRKTGE